MSCLVPLGELLDGRGQRRKDPVAADALDEPGTVELYDRREDPFELVNLASRAEYLAVVTELQLRAAALQSCAGVSCDRVFGPDPEPLPPAGG